MIFPCLSPMVLLFAPRVKEDKNDDQIQDQRQKRERRQNEKKRLNLGVADEKHLGRTAGDVDGVGDVVDGVGDVVYMKYCSGDLSEQTLV